ncbi:hypothetical protein BAE44_0025869 [Dichanthelium oligosanthes]|uniref:Uncharacterized protein n=1 Tax=Dichanthelium oligosanthes TaxID=888268 RepID=A0A1E5UJS5_9POAL|nr:hypothetical protein BAE44_0025869 [Dichanthelium oligosanthes]
MEVEAAADERGKKGAPDGGGGALEWELERQYDFEREMMLMAAAAPGTAGPQQKPKPPQQRHHRPFTADLLQNCDLPPPAKLFGPVPTLQRNPVWDCIDCSERAPCLRRLESAAGTDQKGDVVVGGGGGNNDSLLRALRLSQSRAREAEEKLAAAGASNGELAALLVRDSVALSAHRRWVMMLEAENSLLKRDTVPRGAEPDPDDGGDEADARRGGGGVAAWWVALAVCVGIAGVGLALGRFLC